MMLVKLYWYLWVCAFLKLSLQMQKFAIEPQDQTAIIGSKVTLPCRVINKSGNLQWTRDDFALGLHRNLSDYVRYQMVGADDEGDFSLAIDPISLEDNAKFQCQVGPGRNGESGIRSGFAHLTVLVPPQRPEIVQGEQMVMIEDREIELECISAGGKPAAEIIWIDGSGDVITQYAHYREETQQNNLKTAHSLLKITPIREQHNTTIVCQAQNTAERQYQSAKLQLFVKYAPKVKLEIRSFPSPSNTHWNQIVEGNEVKILCHVDANPTDISYHWYLNDEALFPTVPNEVIIHNISRLHHECIIKCIADNSIGKSEDSETLHIVYGPRFTREPESIQVDSYGTTVTLDCEADSNPPPKISWMHEKHEKTVVGRTSNLSLTVSNETIGKYICKAFTYPFPEISSEAYVHIRGKPVIVHQPVQLRTPGDDIRLNCNIYSKPLPVRLIWSFNGIDLSSDNSDGKYSVLEDITDGGVQSSLVIHAARLGQFGVYNCTAFNKYGADSIEIILKPQGEIYSWLSENSSIILPLLEILGALIIIVTVILLMLSCQQKRKIKPVPPPPIIADLEEHCSKDSDRSSNISEIKRDISTGSSTSKPNSDEFHVAYDSNDAIKPGLLNTSISFERDSKYSINRFSVSDFPDSKCFIKTDNDRSSSYIPFEMDLLKDYSPLSSSSIHSQNLLNTNTLNSSARIGPFSQNIDSLTASVKDHVASSCYGAKCNENLPLPYSNQHFQSPASQYIVARNTNVATIKKSKLATHV